MNSNELLTIAKVNELSEDIFKDLFKNVIEHYPKAASFAVNKRPFDSIEEMRNVFCNFVDQLTRQDKEILLNKHPELSNHNIYKEKITTESLNEQTSVGITSLNNEDKVKLDNYNTQYRAKFSFPFIICARENNAQSIIIAMEERLKNDQLTELNNAIEEVKKICLLRINDLVK